MSNYYLPTELPRKPNSPEAQQRQFRVPSAVDQHEFGFWEKDKALWKIANEYLKGYPHKENPRGLYLYSDKEAGTGKSSFAVSLVRKLIQIKKTKYNSYFLIADDLMEYLRKLYLDATRLRDTEDFQKWMRSDIIVIDDLGVEKLTAFAAGRYYYLLNAFWNEGKHVILTSRFDISELVTRAEQNVEEKMLQNIASRMISLVQEIKFKDIDYR